MFHVSLLCFNSLIINIFDDWNIELLCFIFTFNVSCQKHSGRKTKTLRERFKNTEGAITRSLSVLKVKHETKNETFKSYVSLFEMIDIQLFYNKKWNMKDKMKVLKTYRDSVR